MNWFKKNKKTLFFWLVILAVSPFFIEVLCLADIMGVEVTVGFLVLMFNDYKHNCKLRQYQVTQLFISIGRVLRDHPVCQANLLYFHMLSSMVVLVVTGSMVYAVLTWYPVVVLGDYLLIKVA